MHMQPSPSNAAGPNRTREDRTGNARGYASRSSIFSLIRITPPARRRVGLPRGRIYLMKDMLEGNKPSTPEIVKHIDRCLSCLSCMTTCPSGVHYMHLVDHGRA